MVRTIPLLMPDSEQPSSNPSPQPRTSVLAVIAVVLAVVPLCVPLNLIGAVLGGLARRRIAASPQMIRGRGAATIALWGGLLMAIVGWWAWWAAADWAEDVAQISVSRTATQYLQLLQDGELSKASAMWAPDLVPPTSAQLAPFMDALDGMGPIQAVGIRSMQPVTDGNPWQPTWSAWLVVTVDGGTVDGSGQFDMTPDQSGLQWLIARIRSISISTPTGDVSLPVESDVSVP